MMRQSCLGINELREQRNNDFLEESRSDRTRSCKERPKKKKSLRLPLCAAPYKT